MKKNIVVFVLALAVTSSPAFAQLGEREELTLTDRGGNRFRLAVIYPESYDPDSKHPVIFALPPGPGTPEMVDAILRNYWEDEGGVRGYVLVSPAVVGSSLGERAVDVLDRVFDWMDDNVSYDATRVTLVGQSNGGLGAFHAARAQPQRFASIVVMPGAFGGAGFLDQLKGKPVWLLVGERDTRWVQLSERTRDLLVLAGAEPTLTIVPGQGHVFRFSPRQLYDWIESVTND